MVPLGVDAHAAAARAMSSDEIMPTGKPVSGERTIRCEVPRAAMRCAAGLERVSGRTEITSVAYDVSRALCPRILQPGQQVEVGDDPVALRGVRGPPPSGSSARPSS